MDKAIREIGLKFYNEYQGTLHDYISINIDSLSNNKTNILQLYLINQIVQDVNLAQMFLPRSTPAKSSVIIQQDLAVPTFDHRFHYNSVIGKLNFLENFTRGNISYATRQVGQLCKNPCCTHDTAIKHLSG